MEYKKDGIIPTNKRSSKQSSSAPPNKKLKTDNEKQDIKIELTESDFEFCGVGWNFASFLCCHVKVNKLKKKYNFYFFTVCISKFYKNFISNINNFYIWLQDPLEMPITYIDENSIPENSVIILTSEEIEQLNLSNTASITVREVSKVLNYNLWL